MKEWYALIKSWNDEGYYWQKLISEKVLAPDKKAARELIEEWYQQKFPMRISSAKREPNTLLLSLYEMVPGEYQFVHDMFNVEECVVCTSKFRKVDLINLNLSPAWGACSAVCAEKYRNDNFAKVKDFHECIPVIYKITQISSGKSYIGKTIRSFTLRWWEHIKAPSEGCKFQTALSETDITDWIFQIVEIVQDKDQILERETFWMNQFDSVDNGFNSNVSKSDGLPKTDQNQTLLFES
jgi:hypothetical protein